MISATSRSTFLAIAGAHRFILASSFLAIAVIMTLSYLLNLPASTRLSISAAEQKHITLNEVCRRLWFYLSRANQVQTKHAPYCGVARNRYVVNLESRFRRVKNRVIGS